MFLFAVFYVPEDLYYLKRRNNILLFQHEILFLLADYYVPKDLWFFKKRNINEKTAICSRLDEHDIYMSLK